MLLGIFRTEKFLKEYRRKHTIKRTRDPGSIVKDYRWVTRVSIDRRRPGDVLARLFFFFSRDYIIYPIYNGE